MSASNLVNRNFSAIDLSPSERVASSGKIPALSVRCGVVALVKTKSDPFLARQPTGRTSAPAGNSAGPSLEMIGSAATAEGTSSVVPAGTPFDLRISATRSAYVFSLNDPAAVPLGMFFDT